MPSLIENDLLIPREICVGQCGNVTGFPLYHSTEALCQGRYIILATDGAVMCNTSLSDTGLNRARSVYTNFLEEFRG
jgi:hypothetical protein